MNAPKKVAVMNFSGNVGKTTVAAHLLKPRMGDAQIFSIESINAGADSEGVAVAKLRGKKFGALLDELMPMAAAIVDVGASNVEDFLQLMQQYGDAHQEFEYFVIPVVKEKKAQTDTINTIRSLHKIGIEQDRIRLVFNKVDVDEEVTDEFAPLFGLCETEKTFVVNEKAVIYANEVFDRLRSVGMSLASVTADPRNYREELRQAKTDAEKDRCLAMIAVKRLSSTANTNLDDVFKALFSS